MGERPGSSPGTSQSRRAQALGALSGWSLIANGRMWQTGGLRRSALTTLPRLAEKPTTPPRSSNTWLFEPAADHDLPPMAAIRSVKREPGFFNFVAHAAAGLGFRIYFKLYHRLKVTGKQHLPRKTPFVLISNHTSHLDALALKAALPVASAVHAYPVAAGDVFFDNVASSVITAAFINALPLWRKKATTHALEELRERLARGHSGYILFPEGARSRDNALMPFKAGLGMLVAGTTIPVIPCYIKGAYRAMPPDRTIPRPRRIRIRVGAPLSFESATSDRDGWASVAEQSRRAVDALRSSK